MTGSARDRDDLRAPSAGDRARRPGLFTAGIVLLGVSAVAYGFVNGSGINDPSGTMGPLVTPIWWILYLWFVLRVAGGRALARTAVTVLAVVCAIFEPGMAYGPEGLVAYVLAVVTSAAGVMLLYLPPSRSYFAARGDRRSASQPERQVRQLFEQRDTDGKRVYTVSDIAAKLGMSRMTVYRHLHADQQGQMRQPPDER